MFKASFFQIIQAAVKQPLQMLQFLTDQTRKEIWNQDKTESLAA